MQRAGRHLVRPGCLFYSAPPRYWNRVMGFRLPPLSSLRVFEAAARHNSFRKAADELNLTASAVSNGIQTLESWLGVKLFHRQKRGLRLTDAGGIYAPLVNHALSLLAKA